MRIQKKQKRTSKRRKAIYILLAVIIAIILYCVAAFAFKLFPFSQADVADSEGRKISQSQSEAEKEQVENIEKNPESKTDTPNTDNAEVTTPDPQTGKSEVNVLLTSTGQSIDKKTVDANGFVVNVSETGGSCTYKFTNGAQVVEKKSDTLQNPSSTTCKSVKFPASELGPGTWSVTLQYNSKTSIGSAAPMTLVVE